MSSLKLVSVNGNAVKPAETPQSGPSGKVGSFEKSLPPSAGVISDKDRSAADKLTGRDVIAKTFTGPLGMKPSSGDAKREALAMNVLLTAMGVFGDKTPPKGKV